MNDYRNRVEITTMGVFLQPDPIGFKGDAANIYRFVNNNAVNRIDPMGLEERNASKDIWQRLRSFDSSFAYQASLSADNARKADAAAIKEAVATMERMAKGKDDATAKVLQHKGGPMHGEIFLGQKTRSDPNYLLSSNTGVQEVVRQKIGDKIYYLVHVHIMYSGEKQNTLNDKDNRVLHDFNRPMFFTTRDWITNRRVDIDRVSVPGKNYVVFQPNHTWQAYYDPQLKLP